MSEGISVLHIKQEIDITSTQLTPSCCSPTTTSSSSTHGGGVNRSNSYSNGTTTSNSSSAGTGNASTTSTATGATTTSGSKSSPSVSPDRQLCSSTTTLSTDLLSVSLSGDSASHVNGTTTVGNGAATATSSGGSAASGGTIRDELRRLCLVCGDVASGFHYGVASCEACKAFFKRTIQGNIEYTCPANNECEINKRRRKACQACRFQKCLLMGMLKEGVRLDRVRGGRQKYRRNPISNSYQTMQLLYQSGTTTLDDVKILEVLNAYEPEALTVQPATSVASSATATAGATSDDSQQSGPLVKLENAARSTSTPSTPTPTATSTSTPTTPTSTSTPTTTTTGTCIFHNNNNNDPHDILNVLSDLYDKELVGVIGWAKQIPGFTDLPLNDQMKLLQVSWAEMLTLQLTFRSLPFNGRLCFATDVWMDELLAKECGYHEFYYHCVQIAQRLERLSPRREEYYLLKALLLSNCDILLDDQSALRAFRDTILNALNDVVYLLRHSAAVSHQQQLLLLLPSLRQADGMMRRFWRNVCRDGAVKMNKLFVEMLEPTTR